jgi:hypothetical protein
MLHPSLDANGSEREVAPASSAGRCAKRLHPRFGSSLETADAVGSWVVSRRAGRERIVIGSQYCFHRVRSARVMPVDVRHFIYSGRAERRHATSEWDNGERIGRWREQRNSKNHSADRHHHGSPREAVELSTGRAGSHCD